MLSWEDYEDDSQQRALRQRPQLHLQLHLR